MNTAFGNRRKVAIVGAGSVGATFAYALAQEQAALSASAAVLKPASAQLGMTK